MRRSVLPDYAPPLDPSPGPGPLLEQVPVPHVGDGCPPEMRDQILVDCIHDGWMIPEEFWEDGEGYPIDLEDFREHFDAERDWGAAAVAGRVASVLGLDSYMRVNVARVLMDFGRFPGSTERGADHMHRFAISYPFSSLLSYEQKRGVLEQCYDRISDQLDQVVRGRVIKIAIHTMDTYDQRGTLRPQASVISQAMGPPRDAPVPVMTFDPLYPHLLGQFTCDRVLRDRISLTLEKGRVPVAHNYPYMLPDGSIEVRTQVWFFFRYLRECFEAEFPETKEDPSFVWVWDMLMDTNLRSFQSESLRGYLHLYRRVSQKHEPDFKKAREAYQKVGAFLRRDDSRIVEEYRFSAQRPSSLGIEIRKDVVWTFDRRGRPVGPKVDAIEQIGDLIGTAIATYLRTDRPAQAPQHGYRFGERSGKEGKAK